MNCLSLRRCLRRVAARSTGLATRSPVVQLKSKGHPGSQKNPSRQTWNRFRCDAREMGKRRVGSGLAVHTARKVKQR